MTADRYLVRVSGTEDEESSFLTGLGQCERLAPNTPFTGPCCGLTVVWVLTTARCCLPGLEPQHAGRPVGSRDPDGGGRLPPSRLPPGVAPYARRAETERRRG
jgi:hypothetical protein